MSHPRGREVEGFRERDLESEGRMSSFCSLNCK